MRKINRHDTAVIRNPPTNGPRCSGDAAEPRPRTDDASTVFLANDAWRIARLPGVSSAPPMPCNLRAAISRPMLGATAQMQRCDREPGHADDKDLPPSVTIAERSGKQDETGNGEQIPGRHPLQPGDGAWKSLPIAGWAMPTTVASSCAIALPSTVAVSTHRPRAVPRCRFSESWTRFLPSPASVTPLDVAIIAGWLGMSAVRGDPVA